MVWQAINGMLRWV